jgi:hypothetical protein
MAAKLSARRPGRTLPPGFFIFKDSSMYVSRQQNRTSALALPQTSSQVLSKYLIFSKIITGISAKNLTSFYPLTFSLLFTS